MKPRLLNWLVVSVASVIVGAAFAAVVPSAPARAGFGGGSWGGTGPVSTFSGGTVTTAINFSGIATDVTTPGVEDLTLAPGGVVEVKSSTSTGEFDITDSGGTKLSGIRTQNAAGRFFAGNFASAGMTLFSSVARIGLTATAPAATTRAACLSDGIGLAGFSHDEFCAYGKGIYTDENPQAPAACSAGTTSVDPQSSVITIDAAAAACTATIATTTMATIAKEALPVRITAKNVGAGTLKIASTNFASIPARCSSTGLTAGQSALIAWSQDQAKWIFLGGCE